MNEHALQTLAAKLNALELSEDEEAILAVIIAGRGDEPEVAGFVDGPTAQLRGFNIGMPPAVLGDNEADRLTKGPIVSSYTVWVGGS